MRRQHRVGGTFMISLGSGSGGQGPVPGYSRDQQACMHGLLPVGISAHVCKQVYTGARCCLSEQPGGQTIN